MTMVCALVNGLRSFVLLAACGLKIDQPAYWVVLACILGIITSSTILGNQ